MGKLLIHQNLVNEEIAKKLIELCPFGSIEYREGNIDIDTGCKMCRLCVIKGPNGVIEYIEEEAPKVNKKAYKGIAVYVDHVEGKTHTVTYELIGKAKELAAKVAYPVYCIFLGYQILESAEKLLRYGADKIFVYDYKELNHFRIEPYSAAFEDFINNIKPSIILVGATTIGRSLAPRIAARFRTGITADCTRLEIKENSDLIQIRPAFGGNIMAQIITPNSRPQIATVRYKTMTAPKPNKDPTGEIIVCCMDNSKLDSDIEVIKITKKEPEENISESEIIVVAGRGIKNKKDMYLAYELAEVLGGNFAGTRPMVEAGWIDAKKQIGLSGRTVKPKLIITLGVSGAVQFTAGMQSANFIFAINKDLKAAIFTVAHYGIIGDIYEIVPKLIKNIKNTKELTDEIPKYAAPALIN